MKRRNNILNNEEKKKGQAVGYVCYVPDLSSFIYSKRVNDKEKYPLADVKLVTNFYLESTTMIKIKEIGYNIKTYDEKELFKLPSISHNFSVFKHENKYYGIGAQSDLWYKYLINIEKIREFKKFSQEGGLGLSGAKFNKGLYLMSSEDCIHWSKPKLIHDYNKAIQYPITRKDMKKFDKRKIAALYDSQACIFYNSNNNFFYMYHRYNPQMGERKLGLLKSKTINDWSKSEWTVVKTEGDLNFYTGYIFMKNNKFYGIVNYYKPNMINTKVKYSSFNIGLIESLDGINFKLKKTYIEKCEWLPVMNSVHEINDKTFVYLWNQKGEIYNLQILLN